MALNEERDMCGKYDRPFYQPIILGSIPFLVSCGGTTDFPHHWHGDIEILYVLPGSDTLYVTYDGKSFELPQRSAIFIAGTVVHSVEVKGNRPKVLLSEMGTALLGECFSAFLGKRFTNPVVDFTKEQGGYCERIEEIFLSLSNCLAGSDKTTEDMTFSVRMKISSLLFELASLMTENMEMSSSEKRMKQLEAVKAVQNVLTYIENSYSEKITLETASSMAGYEKTRFSQIFKAAVGTSFHKYLTERRLREAVLLLEKTSLPIARVGEAVGIFHAKSFSRLIRQFYGKTPGEIRKASMEII